MFWSWKLVALFFEIKIRRGCSPSGEFQWQQIGPAKPTSGKEQPAEFSVAAKPQVLDYQCRCTGLTRETQPRRWAALHGRHVFCRSASQPAYWRGLARRHICKTNSSRSGCSRVQPVPGDRFGVFLTKLTKVVSGNHHALNISQVQHRRF